MNKEFTMMQSKKKVANEVSVVHEVPEDDSQNLDRTLGNDSKLKT